MALVGEPVLIRGQSFLPAGLDECKLGPQCRLRCEWCCLLPSSILDLLIRHRLSPCSMSVGLLCLLAEKWHSGAEEGGNEEGPSRPSRSRVRTADTSSTLSLEQGSANEREVVAEICSDPLFHKASATFDAAGLEGAVQSLQVLSPQLSFLTMWTSSLSYLSL